MYETTRIFIQRDRPGHPPSERFNRFDEAESVTNTYSSGRNAREAAERHEAQDGDLIFVLKERPAGAVLRMYRVRRGVLSVEQVNR
jgi:hypothetical protein